MQDCLFKWTWLWSLLQYNCNHLTRCQFEVKIKQRSSVICVFCLISQLKLKRAGLDQVIKWLPQQHDKVYHNNHHKPVWIWALGCCNLILMIKQGSDMDDPVWRFNHLGSHTFLNRLKHAILFTYMVLSLFSYTFLRREQESVVCASLSSFHSRNHTRSDLWLDLLFVLNNIQVHFYKCISTRNIRIE